MDGVTCACAVVGLLPIHERSCDGSRDSDRCEHARRKYAELVKAAKMRRDECHNVAALPVEVYVEHALIGEAFAARMMSENPDLPAEAKQAYEWAEQQFLRIARKEVGERDLIG